jgi:hypothetical protein
MLRTGERSIEELKSMSRWSIVMLAVAAAGCGSGSAAMHGDGSDQGMSAKQAAPRGGQGPASTAAINANALVALKRNLIAAHATFDGAPVTDLRPTGQCTAEIAAGQLKTPIRWSELGNLAPRLIGGRITFSIPSGGRAHVLSAPDGAVGDRIDTGLGLLDANCGGLGNAIQQ